MGTARKMADGNVAAPARHRRFPDEAYAFDADVTNESVAAVRERARKEIEAEEWEVIDGFGRVIHP